MDSNFKRTNYFLILEKNLSSACFQLRNVLDFKIRIMIYYAMFASIIQFEVKVWGGTKNQKYFKL